MGGNWCRLAEGTDSGKKRGKCLGKNGYYDHAGSRGRGSRELECVRQGPLDWIAAWRGDGGGESDGVRDY